MTDKKDKGGNEHKSIQGGRDHTFAEDGSRDKKRDLTVSRDRPVPPPKPKPKTED